MKLLKFNTDALPINSFTRYANLEFKIIFSKTYVKNDQIRLLFKYLCFHFDQSMPTFI